MKKNISFVLAIIVLIMALKTSPASAAEAISLKKETVTLYVGGCKGKKLSCKKAPYSETIDLSKVLANFDEKTHRITVKIEDEDIATFVKPYKIKAVKVGSTKVTVSVFNGDKKLFTDSIKITVKKNARTVEYLGIANNSIYSVDDEIVVTLPKGKDDTDRRRLVSKTTDNVVIKSLGTNSYKVTFKSPGTFVLAAEAYMSAAYPKETASRLITGIVEEASPEAESIEKSIWVDEDIIETSLPQNTSPNMDNNANYSYGSISTDSFVEQFGIGVKDVDDEESDDEESDDELADEKYSKLLEEKYLQIIDLYGGAAHSRE